MECDRRTDFEDVEWLIFIRFLLRLNIDAKLVHSELALNWYFENEIPEEEKLKLMSHNFYKHRRFVVRRFQNVKKSWFAPP